MARLVLLHCCATILLHCTFRCSEMGRLSHVSAMRKVGFSRFFDADVTPVTA